MTLQTSGAISLSQVNVELKLSATATISLNDAAVRKLLGKASGAISMSDAYGKSHEIRFVNTAARTSVSIFALMGSPTAVADYVFENKAEINASTASYALRTGVFPSGSTLTIINSSYIRGWGGTGSSDVNISGGAGGTAIYLEMPCRIDNTNGYIFAGGGGGANIQRFLAGSTDVFSRAGGGGGAGSAAGVAGANTWTAGVNGGSLFPHNVAPKPGTATAGGAGGILGSGSPENADNLYGGAGGANGVAGTLGDIDEGSKVIPTFGAAGAAGRAIATNGKLITQFIGHNSTRVIGAVS